MKKITSKLNRRFGAIMLSISFVLIAFLTIGFFQNSEFFFSGGLGLAAMIPIWIKDNQFRELSNEELQKLEPDELIKYHLALINEKSAKMRDAIDSKASKEDIAEMQREITEFQKEQLKNISNILEIQGKALKKLESKGDFSQKDLRKELESKSSAINKFLTKETGKLELTIKADTLRSSVTNSTQAMRLEDIARLPEPVFALSDLFNKFPVSANSNGKIRYIDWDEATSVRAADMRAEGATFPESTAKWQEYSIDLQKIGDSIPISSEMMQDVVWAESEITNFIEMNVKRKENSQLYNGSGVAPQITGVYTRVSAFDTVAYAASSKAKTTTPDVMDLIKVLKKEIMKGKDGKYNVDFVLISHEEYTSTVLKKDSQGRRLRESLEEMGIKIVPSSFVTDNQLVIGDGRFARVYEIEEYNVEFGWSGTDFIDDIIRMKAKKRMCLLIREADKDGFLKVTDVAAAIVAITA